MVEMLSHSWSFLPRVWAEVLSAFGTTTLAVVVFVILLPITIGIVEWIWAKKGGRGMLSLKSALKEFISKRKVTIVVTLAIWLITFVYFSVVAVYHDHQGLVTKIIKLKSEIAAKDKMISTMKAEQTNTLGLRLKIGGIVFLKQETSTILQVTVHVVNQGRKTTAHDWKAVVKTSSGDLKTVFLPGVPRAKESLDLPRLDEVFHQL